MTQAELAELLGVLRDLQMAGGPLKVHGGAEPGSSAIITLDQQIGVVIQRGHLDIRNAALLRDWLEQEVDRRGLWKEYLAALYGARWQRGETEETRRATLLEVARAALVVAREMKNG